VLAERRLLRLDPAGQIGEDVPETLSRATAMEGDAIRPGELHLPVVRGDRPGPGGIPCAAALLTGPSLLAMVLFEKYG
jgi:hypothetical protein